MKIYAIIYKTTCLVNGKIYIGQHKIQSQKTLDPWYIGSGKPKFERALKKYGVENFKREILCKITKYDEALTNYLEEFFITKYKSRNDEIGYNILKGAVSEHNPMTLKEVRMKVSKTMKKLFEDPRKNPMYGHKHSDDTKHKISEKAKGRRSPRKGIKLSDETKRKISEGVKLRCLDENFRKKLSETHKGILIGDKSPSFGKILINNGKISKMHPRDKKIPRGWKKGGLPRQRLTNKDMRYGRH